MHDLIERPVRFHFFTGKGGVGKTSLSCAIAVGLAGRGRRALLVSTDPASNLDAILGGLSTSTLLNLFIVPALYLSYGRSALTSAEERSEPS